MICNSEENCISSNVNKDGHYTTDKYMPKKVIKIFVLINKVLSVVTKRLLVGLVMMQKIVQKNRYYSWS
jgi:hypothetical protein